MSVAHTAWHAHINAARVQAGLRGGRPNACAPPVCQRPGRRAPTRACGSSFTPAFWLASASLRRSLQYSGAGNWWQRGGGRQRVWVRQRESGGSGSGKTRGYPQGRPPPHTHQQRQVVAGALLFQRFKRHHCRARAGSASGCRCTIAGPGRAATAAYAQHARTSCPPLTLDGAHLLRQPIVLARRVAVEVSGVDPVRACGQEGGAPRRALLL